MSTQPLPSMSERGEHLTIANPAARDDAPSVPVSRTATLSGTVCNSSSFPDLSRTATLANTDQNSPVKSEAPPLPPVPDDEVPDGGYGWVIVGACSVITFFFVGLTYSWGVLQAQLAKDHLASDSTLSFIGSIAIALISVGAIVNTRLIRLMGTRNSALLASVLLGGSQILCGFATKSVPGLFICNSFIGGMGVSIFFMTCGTLPAQYFKRKRGIAGGIIFAAGGVGGGALSIALDALLQRVGVPWTFRIMGLMSLACTLPASLLLKERIPRTPTTVDWSLFKDSKFIGLLVGSGIATFPLLVPPFFIPLYATNLGISTTLGSILLAVFNLSSAVGRIGFGYLGDSIGPASSLFLALLVNSVSLLAIWPVSKNLGTFVAFIVLNGIGGGGFFSTMPSVVSYIYGPKRVSSAFAMIVTGWAFGYILGSPIAGFILNDYGGGSAGVNAFRPAIFYAGAMSLGSAGIILVVRHLMTGGKAFAYS